MKRITEKKLYPVVERWMRRHFCCFATAINKGLRYSRVDVFGVKDIGGDLSGEIETIAIEVKKGGEPFATASGQTAGYRVYANRVYLADVRNQEFTTDEIYIATNLGIGLIQIRGVKCREILSSPHYTPILKLNLTLLEKIGFGKCQMCGCFFKIGEDETHRFSKLTREKLKQSVKDDKGLMFWNYEIANRKNRFDRQRKSGDSAFERRFVCPECITVFFAPLFPKA